MSSAAASSPPSPIAASERAELRDARVRRVLSFTGIAPLGAFVAVHVLTTATALRGAARFERVFAGGSRTVTTLVTAGVLLPLAAHAAIGAWLALTGARLAAPGWLPRLRRGAALITLLFLVLHLWELPARTWSYGARELQPGALYDTLVAQLSATTLGVPLRALAYLIGLGAVLFHFASSLWTFLVSWSVVVGDRAQRLAAWGCAAMGALLFVIGANTVVFFATGTRLVGRRPAPGELLDIERAPCPQPK